MSGAEWRFQERFRVESPGVDLAVRREELQAVGNEWGIYGEWKEVNLVYDTVKEDGTR